MLSSCPISLSILFVDFHFSGLFPALFEVLRNPFLPVFLDGSCCSYLTNGIADGFKVQPRTPCIAVIISGAVLLNTKTGCLPGGIYIGTQEQELLSSFFCFDHLFSFSFFSVFDIIFRDLHYTCFCGEIQRNSYLCDIYNYRRAEYRHA